MITNLAHLNAVPCSVDMLHHRHKALDDGRVVFVDFAKAFEFEHIDHNIVIQKLKSLDVPDFIVRWVTSFLSERQQRVNILTFFRLDNASRRQESQGSWLWSFIFIIVIDDLLMHEYLDD